MVQFYIYVFNFSHYNSLTYIKRNKNETCSPITPHAQSVLYIKARSFMMTVIKARREAVATYNYVIASDQVCKWDIYTNFRTWLSSQKHRTITDVCFFFTFILSSFFFSRLTMLKWPVLYLLRLPLQSGFRTEIKPLIGCKSRSEKFESFFLVKHIVKRSFLFLFSGNQWFDNGHSFF